MVEWKHSQNDGGSAILNYAVEICESKRTFWGRAGTTQADVTKFTAKNLVVGYEYHFRILAVNAEGESWPLEGQDTVTPVEKIGMGKFLFVLFNFS